MWKYERLSTKIEANEQAINAIDSQKAQEITLDAAAKITEQTKKMVLQHKNEKLQAKRDKIDEKLDGATQKVNDSLKNIFKDDSIKLPDKDSSNFEAEAQNLVKAIKAKIDQNPEQYRDFINNMKTCPSKKDLVASLGHPALLIPYRKMKKEHPDIVTLRDAGFRVHGLALDRRSMNGDNTDIETKFNVSNIEISFDPSGKIGRNINNHQQANIEWVTSWEVNKQQETSDYLAAIAEARAAKKYDRKQKKYSNNS